MAEKSRFDAYDSFVQRSYKWIIVIWVIALILMSTQLPGFFSSVNFNIVGGSSGGGNPNSESEKARAILDAEFPNSSNGSSNSVIVVLQGAYAYSDQVKKSTLGLNQTLSRDGALVNYTGMTSIYDTVSSLLNSTVPSLVPQIANLTSSIAGISSGLHTLQANLSIFNSEIFMLENGINQTSQLVYGIPSSFVQVYSGVVSSGVTNPYVASMEANATFYQASGGFGGNTESIGYYNLFYNIWNATFQNAPLNAITATSRETIAVNQSVAMFLSNPMIDNETKQTAELVLGGLSVSDWNQSQAIAGLTMSTIASQIPQSIAQSLGVKPNDLVSQLYDLGPSPSNSSLESYTIKLSSASFSNSSSLGPSTSSLLKSAYDLGPSPSLDARWNLASQFIANSTGLAFASSPLFALNSTSFAGLLEAIGPNATSTRIHSQISQVIVAKTFNDYPIVPKSPITRNLVSKDNASMIFLLNFASSPDSNELIRVSTIIHNSNLTQQGTVYVTGSPVLIHDIENTFQSALGVGVGPGVFISLVIVGILFLAPLAAIIPLMIGGISIGIGLPAMYLSIVKLGHGTITFVTPALSVFLMLGLSVDYVVLQLRRVREERLNGKSKEESVKISIRWAGQAVLTAGITVMVAYIVMAVANVPVFSGVGTAIAIGVSVLLAASLTLLPSLELLIGDRLFWPSLKKDMVKHESFSTRVKKHRLHGVAEFTLKNKIAIGTVIALVALGSVYMTYKTPIGADFLKLVPNFQSNQGLTAIYNSLGSGTVAPTVILITTPTPIVFGHNQFNNTLLNEIELISDRAANSSGVVSVVSSTRPFGSTFDYTSVQNMSSALDAQYLQGMLAQIGKNNKTALVSVGLLNDSESQAATDTLLRVHKNVNGLTLPKGIEIYFGGDAQATYDSVSFILGLLPEVIVILAVAIYVILFVQLRSAFTPLRLIFTILCSVVFALTIISVTFSTELKLPILDFAPLFVVVTMLGVGIDYDIFFVTRIREEVLGGKSNNEAIKTAIEKVWVTILGLGAIFAMVFGALVLSGIAILQEIALAVSAAIIIDVVVVILFFVPSLMGLAEKFNWWPSKIGTTSPIGKNNPEEMKN